MPDAALLLYRAVAPGQGKRAFAAQASYPAGRWTSLDTPVIYASLNPASALLEKLAHRDPGEEEFELVIASMPRALLASQPGLPEDWREWPYRKAVQRSGDAWLDAHAALAIPVPSAIIDGEQSVLIDPLHPRLASISIVDRRRCEIDRRLI